MVAVSRHRFSVDEYRRLGTAGVLPSDRKVELLDGDVVDKMPIGEDHAWVVDLLAQTLTLRLAGRAWVRVQNPIRLGTYSEPEPDITVVRLPASRYRTQHPEPGDVLLLIEVADSSLATDRDFKRPLYAAAGITEYWIVNLVARCIEVYRRPYAGNYQEMTVFSAADQVVPESFPDIDISIADVFGEP